MFGNRRIVESFIKRIEPLDVRDVWDITVENNHSYIGNWYINHNSCKDPNMQQVPPKLRELFEASAPDRLILSSDYSQFEFRACGALAEEEYLIDSFVERAELLPLVVEIGERFGVKDADHFLKKAGSLELTAGEQEVIFKFSLTDIHKRNSALILGKEIADVTPEERQIGKCVSLNSWIHTKDGLMKVGDLLPKKRKAGTTYPLEDFQVVTEDGLRDCKSVYYDGKKKAFRIKTNSGLSLTCSPIHKFRVVHNRKYIWKKAEDLKVGDNILVFMGGNNYITPNEKEKKIKIGETTITTGVFLKLLQLFAFKGTIDGDRVLFPPLTELPKEIEVDKPKGYLSLKNQDLISLCKYWADNNFIPEDKHLKKLSFSELQNFSWECLTISNGMHKVGHSNEVFIEFMQQIFLRSGVMFSYFGPKDNLFGEHLLLLNSSLSSKKYYGKEITYIDKLVNSATDDLWNNLFDIRNKIQNPKDKEEFKKILGKDYDILDFLVNKELSKARITSIDSTEEELCDVTVEDNHTVIYNGFVTHNTLGYAVLYGSGAGTIREQLASSGFLFTEKECMTFQDSFFKHLPKVQKLIKDTHEEVRDKLFVETILGRKRYFQFPPKYFKKYYEKELVDACREGVNFKMQGGNADATKLAMINIYRDFQKLPLNPYIILTVHDEIVMDFHEKEQEQVLLIVNTHMEEFGRAATGYKVPIEVSNSIGRYWGK